MSLLESQKMRSRLIVTGVGTLLSIMIIIIITSLPNNVWGFHHSSLFSKAEFTRVLKYLKNQCSAPLPINQSNTPEVQELIREFNSNKTSILNSLTLDFNEATTFLDTLQDKDVQMMLNSVRRIIPSLKDLVKYTEKKAKNFAKRADKLKKALRNEIKDINKEIEATQNEIRDLEAKERKSKKRIKKSQIRKKSKLLKKLIRQKLKRAGMMNVLKLLGAGARIVGFVAKCAHPLLAALEISIQIYSLLRELESLAQSLDKDPTEPPPPVSNKQEGSGFIKLPGKAITNQDYVGGKSWYFLPEKAYLKFLIDDELMSEIYYNDLKHFAREDFEHAKFIRGQEYLNRINKWKLVFLLNGTEYLLIDKEDGSWQSIKNVRYE